MRPRLVKITLLMLVVAALSAAAGQLLFKVGANERTTPMDFINTPILVGFGMYAFSAVLWVGALSRMPLIKVYPFTVLTFVLVYGGSIMFLQERPTLLGLLGVGIVLFGLYLIIVSQPPRVGSF
jgi:drug/metabolite transporter (DMT)-like permease